MPRALSPLLLSAFAVVLFGCGKKTENTVAPPEFPLAAATAPPVASVAPTETATPSPAATANLFNEVAPRTRNAVVIISAFGKSGHLLGNSHGFFISNDGKLIADRSVMQGAVNAVAKAANGAIYNVAGEFRESGECALLKADASNVAFLEPARRADLAAGEHVAAVLSPVTRSRKLLAETTITAQFNDASGDWFDVSPLLPKSASGAPIINARGEVVGIAILRDGGDKCVIRPSNLANSLASQITPNMTAGWQTASSTTAAPSVAPTAAKSATPPRIPLRGSRLAYAPPPVYPAQLRHSHWPIRGSGSFRIVFDAQGRATSVQTIRSTGNPNLDDSAVQALSHWRAEPGQGWSLNVPITFRP